MCAAEIDFPRGGSAKLSIRSAFRESPKSLSNAKPGAKRHNPTPFVGSAKQKKAKFGECDGEQLVDDAIFRQVVTPELLTQTVRGLAFVKYVRELDVILECVEGIQLILPATQISEEFSRQLAKTNTTLDDLFTCGQAFAFRVIKPAVDKKAKKPTVTVCPRAVNSHLIPSALLTGTALNGTISSIEEKGAVVELGFSSSFVKGFVYSEDLPANLLLSRLHIGQVALFRVKEKPAASSRIVKLTGFVETDSLESDANLESRHLMPGAIVQVEPEKVTATGVFVTIKNGPKAFIRKIHLPPRIRFDLSRATKPFRACVLLSQPNIHMLVLSAHPDVVALSKPEKRLLPPEFKIGSHIVGTVCYCDKQRNIYFKVGGDENDKQMFTAKALRRHIENWEANLPKFTTGTEHKCRIIAYSSVERQLLVTTRSKIVTGEEAQPGQKISGKVKNLSEKGVRVVFGSGLFGFVTAMHVMDNPTKNWQKRFKKDQLIVCRVLFFDASSNLLMLTAKPALVKAAQYERQITRVDDSFVGSTATGVVIKQLGGGSVLVAFYNRVVGLLPSSYITNLRDEIKVGMPIRVVVKSFDTEQGHMLLQLPSVDGSAAESGMVYQEAATKNSTQKSLEKVNPGLIRPAKPFQIYTAKVLGPWPYGGTSHNTTAELEIPGGSVGRLHVSELNGLQNEGSFPMQEFIMRNTGKTINVKVLCVSKAKSITDKGREMLEKRHQLGRMVECTAKLEKLQEPRKKLNLIKFTDEFSTGDILPAFIVPSTSGDEQNVHAEINPDFRAIFPRDQLEDKKQLFDDGEMRLGKVVGVNKTKRGKVVVMRMVSAKEVDESVMEKIFTGGRKRIRTLSVEESKEDQKEHKDEPEKTDEEEEEMDADDEHEVEELKSTIVVKLDGEALGTVEEYEQAVLAHPQSVRHWVGYLQFILQQMQAKVRRRYELGREVAEQALNTITFGNDANLVAIWRAYLNVEVALGTEDSLREVFVRACAATDPHEMHKFLINLLKCQTNAEGREEEIRELFESMIKKFHRRHLDPWFSFAKHLLQQGDSGQSQQLLERALNCTEKRKHTTILKRFAQLEERFGDKERAKTIWELMKKKTVDDQLR